MCVSECGDVIHRLTFIYISRSGGSQVAHARAHITHRSQPTPTLPRSSFAVLIVQQLCAFFVFFFYTYVHVRVCGQLVAPQTKCPKLRFGYYGNDSFMLTSFNIVVSVHIVRTGCEDVADDTRCVVWTTPQQNFNQSL